MRAFFHSEEFRQSNEGKIFEIIKLLLNFPNLDTQLRLGKASSARVRCVMECEMLLIELLIESVCIRVMKSFEAPLAAHSINCQKLAERIIKSQVSDQLTHLDSLESSCTR